MFVTIFLILILLFLTLLSTSFHLTNLSLVFLLGVLIFRKKHFGYLVLAEAIFLSLFTALGLGTSLLLITLIVWLFLMGEENIFPGRKRSSLVVVVAMMVVWEVSSSLVF